MWNPLKVVLPGMRVGDLHYSLFRPEHSSRHPPPGASNEQVGEILYVLAV